MRLSGDPCPIWWRAITPLDLAVTSRSWREEKAHKRWWYAEPRSDEILEKSAEPQLLWRKRQYGSSRSKLKRCQHYAAIL